MNEEKISTRDAFGHALVHLKEEYPNTIVLDAGVSSATRTIEFKRAYPHSHFNCGISEANMFGVAAGIAAIGYPVFASTFAIFAAGRAYEQIRTSIGYTHLPVRIAATHAGISVGSDGATHQCFEDIALMRVIPGMTIISPSDSIETLKVMSAIMKLDGPVYLRLCKVPSLILHSPNYEFRIDEAQQLIWGEDVTIIATGIMVEEAIKASLILRNENISVRVINMVTLKPIDRKAIISAAKETGAIVTVEDHSVIGGLGDEVSRVVSEIIPVPVLHIGINDTFGQSGKPAELLQHYGLCVQNICKKVKDALLVKLNK